MTMRMTGGSHRGRKLRVPGATGLRPTSERVRAAVFSILGPDACRGVRVLDLYAGTGMLGMEALSRGAEWTDFVEVDARLVRHMRSNLSEMSLEGQTRVYRARVERVLDRLTGGYGLVFADPPYAADVWDQVMGALGRHELVIEGGAVVAEHRYMTVLAETYGVLTQETRRRYGDTGITVYRA